MDETCTIHLGERETKSVLKTLNGRKHWGTGQGKIKMDLDKRVWTRYSYNWLNATSVASSSIP
jgi:hypothetical protein